MHSRRDILKCAAMTTVAAGLPSGWAFADQGTDEPLQPSARVARFERLAFGMFIHWGLYSQLGKGEWAKKLYSIPTDEYMQLMSTFTASDFSGRELAKVAKSAGMKYMTLTSRHHDGFSLYDTRGLSKYDVTKTPAARDLILDFVEGCRAEGIVPMLYCTTLDWTDERFENDWDGYLQYLRDSVELLCTKYGQIGGFWFDGNWSRPKADWQEDKLYALIRKHQPEAMIINNTGIDAHGSRGHPEIDSTTFERGRPERIDRTGWTKYIAGEMCLTLNFHWGIGTKDFNYLSPAHVIEEFCRCRRAGANLLLNVGPTAGGAVPEYERALLKRVGEWCSQIGGGSLFEGRVVGTAQEDDFALVQETSKGVYEISFYCFGLTPTADTRVHQKCRGPGQRAFAGVNGEVRGLQWVDGGGEVVFKRPTATEVVLDLPKYREGVNTVVRVAKGTWVPGSP